MYSIVQNLSSTMVSLKGIGSVHLRNSFNLKIPYFHCD